MRFRAFLRLVFLAHVVAGAAYAQRVAWESVLSAGAASAVVVVPSGSILAQIGQLTYRSTDRGVTWMQGGVIPGDVTILKAAADGSLYAGTWMGVGLFRSTDEGASWKKVTGLNVYTIWDVAVDSRGTIFLATEGDYVQRSTDHGSTWTRLSAAGMGRYVWGIGVDGDDNVFAGTQGEGIFRSTNNGDSWTQTMSEGIFIGIAGDHHGYLYAATDGDGLYRSDDDGVSWMKTTLGEGVSRLFLRRSIVVDGDDRIDVGTSGGLLRSADHGATWGNPTSSTISINALALDSAGNLYAATQAGIARLGTSSAGSSIDAPPVKSAPSLSLAGCSVISDVADFAVTLSAPEHASLSVVDVEGAEVMRIFDGPLDAGSHRFTWNVGGVSCGAYFCHFLSGARSEWVRLMVVR